MTKPMTKPLAVREMSINKWATQQGINVPCKLATLNGETENNFI